MFATTLRSCTQIGIAPPRSAARALRIIQKPRPVETSANLQWDVGHRGNLDPGAGGSRDAECKPVVA